MIHHKFRFFSLKTLIAISLIITATSMFTGYRIGQIYEMEKITAAANLVQHRSTNVNKVAMFYMAQNPRLWERLAVYMAEHTVNSSEKYEVPLKIVVGVVSAESTAHPFAKSHTGAIGSSQVDFKAHAEDFPELTTARDKYDPQYNIPAGMFLLHGYIKKYGIRNALQVYNVGEGAFSRGKRNWKYTTEVLNIASEFDL